MNYEAANVIAEIGCNHKGDINIAKNLIKTAYECGANIVKFQKRSNKELLTKEQYNSPHPNPIHAYGDSYGAHREFLEFNIDQHFELKKYAENLGLIYSSSVWDLSSAKEIVSLNPEFIKVPSACNNNFEILQFLSQQYSGKIHISLGMTTKREEKSLIDFFTKKNQLKRLVIYACTSGYPVSFDDVCMLEILRLKNNLADKVYGIGFSGHHLGIAVDIAAYTLGANWIERHFTLDRTWKGTDHSASLEPTGLKKLSRDLQATYKCLSYKENDLLAVEIPQRDKLKYKK
ncbi:MAG: N-acetylneuraminate synthase [Flavobacteriales bacterium]|nr:N-acetylneuraminate synthase [Flavobacteriales bacterium]|tara:strand:- start:5387 stop:6253 length:867 start_codon:yes stop_codon:yes gene_type:complete